MSEPLFESEGDFRAFLTATGHPPDAHREGWALRVCRCGSALGSVRAAIRLKTCPDCGNPTVPVEDVTRNVYVEEVRREVARCEANVDLTSRCQQDGEEEFDGKWLCRKHLCAARGQS